MSGFGVAVPQHGKDREAAEFLLRACHDLRAAARAVRSHSELFLREPGGIATDPEIGKRLGFIADGAARIDLLIDGLAAYSTAILTEPGSFQSVKVGVLLRLAIARLEKLLREAEAQVTYDELPAATGNPDRLIDVFENIIRNAVENRDGETPRIHVAAAPHPTGWLFTVRDNGTGIDPNLLDRIFRPFERLPGRRRNGAGLGLAICRAIIERHGGTIWAESVPGQGARFCFTLPAADAAAQGR